jgi:DHA1 family multidrug resistance protein-like MFS transporter
MDEARGRGRGEDGEHSPSWRRNLCVLWFAEFIAIAGFSVVIPILPLYVAELGVEGDRQTRLWSGIILSAHAVTMAAMAPVWGALSDRYGRKVMVERAMFGGALLLTLMGFARNVQQLALLRAVQGMLTGTVTAATALVATTAPRKHTGHAMGTLQMAIYAGASVGPLLGGAVADALGFRAAYTVTGMLLLLAALAVLVFVREPPTHRGLQQGNAGGRARAKATLQARAGSLLSPVLGSGLVLSLLGVRLLMRLAVRMPTPTLPLFVESIAPAGSRVATITGLITGVGALTGALGARQLGKLSDRIGYRTILIVCAAASMAFYLPQTIVGRPIWLLILQGCAGLAMGGILASISAALAIATPVGREGILYGVDATVVSVANTIGPISGSLLAAYVGLRAPFLAAAVVFALAGLAAFWLLPRSER